MMKEKATKHEAVIELKHLSKYFTVSQSWFRRKKVQVKAVDDISLQIRRGEIVGLVGESGSGKTTLARVILNLTKAEGEKIFVDGVDLRHASTAEMKRLRSEVAVVFQDPAANLNPRQTVGASIMRPLIIHGHSRAAAREKALEALRKVQMDDSFMASYPHQLSGGQQQRIAIARALVLRPKIMILDEPTSALDISVQAQVLNLLLDLQQELGLTYLVITHDLNVIRYISDRIFVMYLGKLVEYGSTEQVFEQPLHPYTKGLMAAVPILDPSLRGRKPTVIGGEPGSLIELSAGCRLSGRCPYAQARCQTETPPLQDFGTGHCAACFYADALHVS